MNELHRMNRLILEAFLTLIRSMKDTPTETSGVARITKLILSQQQLLSALRPTHAREELIATLHTTIEAKQNLIDELRAASAACADATSGIGT